MAQPHRWEEGEPRTLIGTPFVPGWVPFIPQPIVKETPMAKAKSNGYYILDGSYFTAPAGTELPEGAEFVESEGESIGQSEASARQFAVARKAQAKTAKEHAHVAAGQSLPDDEDEPEKRDKGAAPENRKKS
jgi:hypothetical protein